MKQFRSGISANAANDECLCILGSINAAGLVSSLAKEEDAAHTSGDMGLMMLAVRNDGGAVTVNNDQDYIALTTDSSGNLRVNVAGGGLNGVVKSEDASSLSGDTGIASLIERRDTLVANGGTSQDADYTRMFSDNFGRLYVTDIDVGHLVDGTTAADIINTTVTQVIAAGGAGVRTYLYSLQLSNTSGVATKVDILDGATVRASVMLKAGDGKEVVFPKGLRGTANTGWNVQCLTTATVTRASAQGIQLPG